MFGFPVGCAVYRLREPTPASRAAGRWRSRSPRVGSIRDSSTQYGPDEGVTGDEDPDRGRMVVRPHRAVRLRW